MDLSEQGDLSEEGYVNEDCIKCWRIFVSAGQGIEARDLSEATGIYDHHESVESVCWFSILKSEFVP